MYCDPNVADSRLSRMMSDVCVDGSYVATAAPLNYMDPTGNVAESVWDAASLGVGGVSLYHNVKEGNVLGAIIDGIGMAADAVALVIPFVPGGVGMAIKAARGAGIAIDAVQAQRVVNSSVRVANRTSNFVQNVDAAANAYQAYDALENNDLTGFLFSTLHVGIRGMNILDSHGLEVVSRGLNSGIPIPSIRRKANAAFESRDVPTFRLTHDEFVQKVRPGATEHVFHPSWSEKRRLGSRRYDDYDEGTLTAFEGNTTPWAEMTHETLHRKLDQIGADVALLRERPSEIRRIVWFGTDPLPTQGLGKQIRQALDQAGIKYWVVKT